MNTTDVATAQRLRNEADDELSVLRIRASEASARAQIAEDAELVEACRIATQAQEAARLANKRLSDAENTLKLARREEAKLTKQKVASDAQKARKVKAGQFDHNPFLAEEIDWPALGAWLVKQANTWICYVEGAGWGEWTGTHWEFTVKPSPPLLDRVRKLYCCDVGDVVRKLNQNPRSAQYLLDHAQGALTLPRERFNSAASAYLLPFRNGTVDLRSGKFIDSAPEHYLTGYFQCDYDESADIDRIRSTFGRYWPNDPETADMFQVALGYSATGETSAKRIFFLVGNQGDSRENGDNGKSLVQGALLKLFGKGQGSFGATVKPGIILDAGERDANGHDGAMVPLIWRRLAIASEFRPGSSIDAGAFNRISGGDQISARAPHAERSVDFVPSASLWFSMNTVARFKTWDKATRIRLTPFPFTQSFHDPGQAPPGGQEKELGLKEWLESEDGLRALALYIVVGAKRFYDINGGKAGNFPNSAAVNKLRDELLEAANPFEEMFEEWLKFDDHFDTTKSCLSALLAAHIGARPRPHERETFISALKGRGVVEVKINGTRYWRGVGLTRAGQGVARSRGQGSAERKRVVEKPAA